jgi:hypothetical protein
MRHAIITIKNQACGLPLDSVEEAITVRTVPNESVRRTEHKKKRMKTSPATIHLAHERTSLGNVDGYVLFLELSAGIHWARP